MNPRPAQGLALSGRTNEQSYFNELYLRLDPIAQDYPLGESVVDHYIDDKQL